MTLANDFLIYYLLFSAIYIFLFLGNSLGAIDLISARLALGEVFKEAVIGLKCLEDCVPVVTPVAILV
jgi:hypothetical protein